MITLFPTEQPYIARSTPLILLLNSNHQVLNIKNSFFQQEPYNVDIPTTMTCPHQRSETINFLYTKDTFTSQVNRPYQSRHNFHGMWVKLSHAIGRVHRFADSAGWTGLHYNDIVHDLIKNHAQPPQISTMLWEAKVRLTSFSSAPS